jgi:hypothetical protein
MLTAVQLSAAVAGFISLLIGMLDFMPGLTAYYDTMKWSGRESNAELFGLFQVSGLHNMVHLLYGVAGLTLTRWIVTSRVFLIIGGLGYLTLWVYGLVIDHDDSLNFIPLNTADDWLHCELGAGMIALGLLPAATVGAVDMRSNPDASVP